MLYIEGNAETKTKQNIHTCTLIAIIMLLINWSGHGYNA